MRCLTKPAFSESVLYLWEQNLEQQCFNGAASKAVYLSVLANICRGVGQSTRQSSELTACHLHSTSSQAHDGSISPANAADPSASALWEQICPALAALEVNPADDACKAIVTQSLHSMLAVSVTREELAGGLGKSLKGLTKHADVVVSQAAKAVVAAFKEQVEAKN